MTSSEQAQADASHTCKRFPFDHCQCAQSHECDACGGTGYKAQAFDPVWPFKDAKPCPVCLGSGRISDRMPVADALADAETLRRNNPYCNGWSSLDVAQDMGYAVQVAARNGNVTQAATWATASARTAFRAVPGLRGE